MSDAERAAAELLINRALQGALVLYGAWFLGRRAWRRAGLPALPIGAWLGLLMSGVSDAARHLAQPAPALTSSTERAERPNERANEPATPARTALHEAAERLQVDRSRAGLVAVLVAAGWGTVDIRDQLKGTAADVGADVKAARDALATRAAGEAPPRTIVVRDGASERTIAL